MKYVLLCLIGAMYLPSLMDSNPIGGIQELGTLKTSDYLVLPTILTLLAMGTERFRTIATDLLPLLVTFLTWTLLGVLLILPQYNFVWDREFLFSLLKFGKFSVYVLLGMLFTRAIKKERYRDVQLKAVIVSSIVNGAGLIYLFASQFLTIEAPADFGYDNTNGYGVLAACSCAFLEGLLINGLERTKVGYMSLIALVVSLLGLIVSDGRGAWVALFVASLYIVYKARRRLRRTVFVFSLLSGIVAVMYNYNDVFHEQVSHIIAPDDAYQSKMEENRAGIAGFDDGRRLTTAIEELSHLSDAPVLGTGFFHRGGKTNLSIWGSHSFFIQVLLETGFVGCLILLLLLVKMWKLSERSESRQANLELPNKAALITAVVGGMSGEYFYGGVILLNVLIIFSSVGRLRSVRDETA
jgi:O-antigen ligase